MVFPVRSILFLAVMGGLLAGCSASDHTAPAAVTLNGQPKALPSVFRAPVLTRGASTIASLPDRGSLMAYSAVPARHEGASTWHAVQLSEAHALRSIDEGGLVINTPDGRPIRLKYERHVAHPDGNWTWIGRLNGRKDAPEAILTFGDKAVFGSIPNGNQAPLELATVGGRTWMVETDTAAMGSLAGARAAQSDFVPSASIASAAKHSPVAGKPVAAAARRMAVEAVTATPPNATVDLVLGYTSAFATRLGGASQAETRLNFLVDVANQAYSNSDVGGRLRLVRTVEVDYPDATSNRSALFDVSGLQCNTVASSQIHLPDADVACTSATVPAGLQPLVQARAQYGADLVSLVRNYSVPENQSCGIAWLIGGGQQPIDASSAAYGYSVISDSSGDTSGGSTCRNETLAHELGHNMGLAHDEESAAGSDDADGDGSPLDAQEYGRFAYSFGYSASNFYTIMSLPSAGQRLYRVFSNPRVTFCGGSACGSAQADNARTLLQTMPLVANFRTSKVQSAGIPFRGDFNGDGKSDLFWRNTTTGANIIWLSGNASTQQSAATVSDTAWSVEGVGDFNGDGRSDIFWRNTSTGSNVIWYSGNAGTYRTVATVPGAEWGVVGTGDFNGDGQSDLLWRNGITGGNLIWRSANPSTQQHISNVPDASWIVAAVGDFDGDHKSDIFWRNTVTGSDTIWRSANSSTTRYASPVTDTAWVVAGAGDFNADGRADILWRHSTTGQDIVWDSGNAATSRSITSVTDTSWNVVGFGDFDGDHKADFFWRNAASGSNVIWRAGNSANWMSVPGVTNLQWVVAG
jgi:hypothetical protein